MRKDIEIYETRMEVYARDLYICQHPGCDVIEADRLQMAHRIAKGKGNNKYVRSFVYRVFGKFITKSRADKILNHPDNLVTSCSRHNSYFNIGNRPVERDELLKSIYLNS